MKQSEVSHSTRDTPTTQHANLFGCSFLRYAGKKPSETSFQSDLCEQQVSTVVVDLFKTNHALYKRV